MGQLRDELKPNATKERIEIVKCKIKEIEETINQSNDVKQLIDNFNEFTNRDYDKEYFMTYWNSESIDDFARDAAQPVPKRIDNISKAEYVEIVERLKNADDNAKFYLDLLERNLPHPRISDLIYWPENEGLTDDSTSEEIVDKAMNYKVIQI